MPPYEKRRFEKRGSTKSALPTPLINVRPPYGMGAFFSLLWRRLLHSNIIQQMNHRIKSVHVLGTFLICASGFADAEERTWTSKSGSKIVGSILSKSSNSITIIRQDKSIFTVALDQISVADQKYAEEWKDPMEEGLIYYCDFDDKTANDKSRYSNHGTLVGTTSGLPRKGKSGNSRVFDGRDDSIRLPIDINPSKYPQLTVSVWAKPARTLRMGKILSHDDGGYDRTLGVDKRGAKGAGDFQWVAFCGSGKVLGSEKIDSRDWVFLAVVYDQKSQEVTLYVDNRRYSKKGILGVGHRFTNIGSNPTFGAFFDGSLDDLRIYSRALPEEEITKLLNR
ncbi:MAG: LamG domain-containing protein [Anaerolineales bacterium]